MCAKGCLIPILVNRFAKQSKRLYQSNLHYKTMPFITKWRTLSVGPHGDQEPGISELARSTLDNKRNFLG